MYAAVIIALISFTTINVAIVATTLVAPVDRPDRAAHME
jgi:hypothetical protein